MIKLTFKRVWKDHPTYAVYETKINRRPMRVKILKNGAIWEQVESSPLLLHNYLKSELYQHIDLKVK